MLIQQEYITHRIYYTDLTCLAPKTTGTIHSGSVDCILSSISIEWNFKRWRRGSPAPTQVQHITSAASRSSFSAAFFSIRYRFSSTDESSPVSSLSCCNFWSSVLLWRKKWHEKFQYAGLLLLIIDMNTTGRITVKAGRRLSTRSYLWTVMTQGHFCVMWYWTKAHKSTQDKQDYEL